MKKLTGKVAVVTGASKGIGAAIAKQLAADGADVVVNYATSREGADKVVEEITGAGGKAIAVGASVAKEGDIQTLFEETRRTFGKVDILVNNAGVYGFAPLEQVTFDENISASMKPTSSACCWPRRPRFRISPPKAGASSISVRS